MDDAAAHFERGLALEDSDAAAARLAYSAALAVYSGHLEARINLGRLMHLSGELEAAEALYRAAKQTSALLAFNLALLLEDLGRDEDAVVAYRESLALDPEMHESHLNLGLLYERQQRPREALRHMLAFHRSGPQ
jgi:Flp pilus assembly protein TadD